MNKKLRTLLLTGVLFVNLGGVAFAGNGNDGCQVPGLRGHESSNEHKIENVTQETFLAWVDEVNSTNTGIVIEAPNNYNGNGWHTFKVYEDKDFDHEKDDNKQIEVLHVKFNVSLTDEEKKEKNDEPVVPPEEPEEPVEPPTDPDEPQEPVDPPQLPEEEPETSDASLIGFIGAGLASIAGLFVLNKKDE